MVYDLFSNIAIVVAFLFVVGQVFGKYPIDNKLPLRIQVVLGVCFGVLGIILMLYSIDVTSTIIVDMRNISIISAGVIGGPLAAVVASVLIAAYRVLHFGVTSASVTALIVAVAMGSGCAFISNTKVSRLKKFSYMLIYAITISSTAFIYLIRDFHKLLVLFSYYIPITFFGILLAYFAVEYIISKQVIERKLKKTNGEISDILESIQDAFFTLDQDWKFAYANKKFITMLSSYDKKFSDILGKHSWTIFPREAYKDFYSEFSKVMADKVPVHFEGYSQVTNRWYYTNVYPKNNGISVYFRDITEQKQVSQRLIESEQRFRSLVNSINDVVYTLDMNQQYTSVFGKWLKKSGFEEENFIGKTSREIFGEEYAAAHEMANTRALNGEYVVYDWSINTENGTTYYQTSLSPIRNYYNKIIGIVGVGRNVTTYKTMEDSLRESEERFRAAFEYAAVGVALVTIEGNYIRVNQPYCNMVGYSEEELQDISFMDLTHPDDAKGTHEVMKKLLNGDIPSFHIEMRYVHKKGHNIWVQVNSSVVRDREGNPKYYIAQVQDITNRIMAAEELKQINNELIEQRGEAERQREEAMEANKHKSQFLAMMSHELRTPLNSVIGFTNRVIKKCADVLPQTQLENLGIVKDEAQHLLELINSLLDYSKIEAGKMEVYAEEFDLKEIINEVSTMTNNIAESKHLRYIQQLPATGDIMIYSDKLKVKQILINLISNAFKYSEKGTVILSVTIVNKFYRLEVEDEGIGISPEHLERIFDEFRQVDGTFTRKVGGTGLGLSITKRFVEMLGGSIEVQSKFGIGSKFTVYLPIRYSDRAEA